MKKIGFSLVMTAVILTALEVAASAYGSKNNCKLFILGMSDVLRSNLLFILVPLLVGIASLLLLTYKVRGSKSGKWLPAASMILCCGFLAICSSLAKSSGSIGSRVYSEKSPDGKHTMYYIRRTDDANEEYRLYYRRTGVISYEDSFHRISIAEGSPEIQWGSDCITYDGRKYEYSSYGDD